MNLELFDQKQALLADEKLYKELEQFKPKDKVACIYHGIKLNIFSQDNGFIQELNNFIPQSWHSIFNADDGFNIYFIPPLKFGFTIDEWTDEASQDCYDSEINKVGVQRDFAAKEYKKNSIVVIAENKVSDGFFNFLRWFLSRKLIDNNTVILHSACIRDVNKKTHFFLGHSGAGKTTITTLKGEREVLGDDMNLLSLQKNSVLASAGAIGGRFLSQIEYSEKLPISSFNWLVQSNVNKRTLLSEAEARVKLIASVSNIFWESLEEKKIEKIMDIIVMASKKIPFYELSFKKDNSFWNLFED